MRSYFARPVTAKDERNECQHESGGCADDDSGWLLSKSAAGIAEGGEWSKVCWGGRAGKGGEGVGRDGVGRRWVGRVGWAWRVKWVEWVGLRLGDERATTGNCYFGGLHLNLVLFVFPVPVPVPMPMICRPLDPIVNKLKY